MAESKSVLHLNHSLEAVGESSHSNLLTSYYCNFQRQQKLQQLTTQIAECEKKIASTTEKLEQANSGREKSVGIFFCNIEYTTNFNLICSICSCISLTGSNMWLTSIETNLPPGAPEPMDLCKELPPLPSPSAPPPPILKAGAQFFLAS